MRRRACVAAMICATMIAPFAPTRAHADDTAIAQALFDEGRKLANEGKCEEASAKFTASLKVQPTVGALLNLADCAEKLGQKATAWAHFEEAAALAKRKKDDRETYARDRAATLAPKLARLTLKSGAQPAGVEIRRDGALIDAAALGVAVPVDAGVHAVDASAPGHRPFHADVDVATDGVSIEVTIPTLAPIVAATSAPSTSTTAVATTRDSTSATSPPSPSSSARTFAWIAGGVGVVGVGVGAFFGLRARARWNEAQSTCTAAGCTVAGADEASDARHDGVVSTISFGVGVAGLGAAALLWLTTKDDAPVHVAPAVGDRFAGVSLGGAF